MSTNRARHHVLLLLAILGLTIGSAGPTTAQQMQADEPPAWVDVTEKVGQAIEGVENQPLPGAAVLAIVDGEIVARGIYGVRAIGDESPVAFDDRWHIGSCTKAMTATLFARLCHAGEMEWEATLADLFPAIAEDGMHEAFRAMTLPQLMAHRSGIADPFRTHPTLWRRMRAGEESLEELRMAAAEIVLTAEPDHTPGADFQYANVNYMIAGAAMERATGATWEALMQREIAAPLGIETLGFGAPGTVGAETPDAPYGHGRRAGDRFSIPPGPNADNPPALGPAGTVHISLPDWARFLAAHLAGAKGDESFLPAAMWNRLHAPWPIPEGVEDANDAAYGQGWGIGTRGWAGGTVLTHNGSNTMWSAICWVAPEKGIAVMAAGNIAEPLGWQALDAALGPALRVARDRVNARDAEAESGDDSEPEGE